MLDRGPEMPRDVAMATNLWLSMGYNFGCIIANDTQFDSRGWVFGVKLSNEEMADFEIQRDVAMATIFCLSVYGGTLAPPGEYN